MVAALLLDEYKAMCVIPGSIDREEFLDYITNDMICSIFYLFGFLLNHLPAAKHEPLPSGQEHFDSQQLCNSQDMCPSKNSQGQWLSSPFLAAILSKFQSNQEELQL